MLFPLLTKEKKKKFVKMFLKSMSTFYKAWLLQINGVGKT